MPSVRELSAAELAGLEYGNESAQAQIAAHYDRLLGSFSLNEYGTVPPMPAETCVAVRACLVAAAERRGRRLLFVPMNGDGLLFRVYNGVSRWSVFRYSDQVASVV